MTNPKLEILAVEVKKMSDTNRSRIASIVYQYECGKIQVGAVELFHSINVHRSQDDYLRVHLRQVAENRACAEGIVAECEKVEALFTAAILFLENGGQV